MTMEVIPARAVFTCDECGATVEGKHQMFPVDWRKISVHSYISSNPEDDSGESLDTCPTCAPEVYNRTKRALLRLS